MPYQIRIRRDEASNWENNDPILALGELGFDMTNNEVKVGDGSTAWTALTPIRASSDAALISGIAIEAGSPSNGDVLQYDSGTNTWTYAPMTGGGGSGTVTSVGLDLPNTVFSISNSPVSVTGTLTGTFINQSGNRVFAGPTSGAFSAPPTFRALVAADLPDLSTLYQPLDSVLTSIDSATTLDTSADKIFYTTGSKAVTLTPLSSYARTLIDDADAAASRSTLGLGAITVGSTANTFDAIAWDTTPATTIAEAKLQWNTAYSTLELGLDASVTCKIGQGLYKLCHNNTGADINKGDVVFISGSLGTTLLTVAKARADAESTSATTVGVAAETFSHGTTGFIQVFGFLDGLTTNTISNSPKTGTIAEGDAVYLSESTAGGLRGLLPVQPNHGVRVGFLVKSAGGSGGSIFVNVQNYQELEELSDVYIPTTPAGNDMLVWDSGDSRWENRTTAQVLSNIGAAASSHTHGTISNDGKIGSDAGRVIVTTTNGALQALTDGSPNYVLSTNGSGTLSWVAQSGGGGTPGGTDTQVQFNDGGSTFGGDAGFTYVKATDALTVAGSVTTGEVIVTNQGLLKLNEGTGGGTNYVGLKSPSTLANNNEYTFPNAVGAAGKMLGIDTVSTNNATLKWATVNDVYSLFTPLMAVAPASNYATLDIQNDIFVLDFDQGTSESVIFQGVLPNNADLTNGLYIKIYWTAAWTTSASTVEWKIELANLEIGTVMSKAYDTATVISKTYGTTTTLTVGLSETTVAVADTDGLGAGDPYQLKITRNTAGTDDMGTDAMLIAVEVSRA